MQRISNQSLHVLACHYLVITLSLPCHYLVHGSSLSAYAVVAVQEDPALPVTNRGTNQVVAQQHRRPDHIACQAIWNACLQQSLAPLTS